LSGKGVNAWSRWKLASVERHVFGIERVKGDQQKIRRRMLLSFFGFDGIAAIADGQL